MEIEVQYFRGCPSPEPLRNTLQEILREEGAEATLRFREVRSETEAKALRFPGSPTILIDGVEFQGQDWEEEDYGLKCRTYDNEGVIMSWPSKESLREAIQEAIVAEDLGGRRRIGGCC